MDGVEDMARRTANWWLASAVSGGSSAVWAQPGRGRQHISVNVMGLHEPAGMAGESAFDRLCICPPEFLQMFVAGRHTRRRRGRVASIHCGRRPGALARIGMLRRTCSTIAPLQFHLKRILRGRPWPTFSTTRWAPTASSSSNTPRPIPSCCATLFERMGFPAVARHRSKNVTLHRQGDINFIVNAEPDSFGQRFAQQHGPVGLRHGASASRTRPRRSERAVELGATPVQTPVGPMELNIPAIEGIGGSLIYLVDRYGDRTIYDVDFVPVPQAVPSRGGRAAPRSTT